MLEVRVQPNRLTAKGLGLYNSIHSSAACAAVPPHATSLMATRDNPAPVGVGVDVNNPVGVRVGVGGALPLGVGVGNVVEFARFGVPLMGLPSASSPLR